MKNKTIIIGSLVVIGIIILVIYLSKKNKSTATSTITGIVNGGTSTTSLVQRVSNLEPKILTKQQSLDINTWIKNNPPTPYNLPLWTCHLGSAIFGASAWGTCNPTYWSRIKQPSQQQVLSFNNFINTNKLVEGTNFSIWINNLSSILNA